MVKINDQEIPLTLNGCNRWEHKISQLSSLWKYFVKPNPICLSNYSKITGIKVDGDCFDIWYECRIAISVLMRKPSTGFVGQQFDSLRFTARFQSMLHCFISHASRAKHNAILDVACHVVKRGIWGNLQGTYFFPWDIAKHIWEENKAAKNTKLYLTGCKLNIHHTLESDPGPLIVLPCPMHMFSPLRLRVTCSYDRDGSNWI